MHINFDETNLSFGVLFGYFLAYISLAASIFVIARIFGIFPNVSFIYFFFGTAGILMIYFGMKNLGN